MIIWDLEKNFWTINPLMELHFREIKEDDKSKNKELSSLRMWCIAFCGDYNSPYKNTSKEELNTAIYDAYLKERERTIELIWKENGLEPNKVKDKPKDKSVSVSTSINTPTPSKESALNLLKDKKYKKDKVESIENKVSSNSFKFNSVFDIDMDEPYIQRMINVTHPKTKRMLKKWEDKLEEWQLFIEKTKVEESTYEMIGKMMTQSHTMWKQYYAIKKEADAETEQQTVSGSEESFLEEEWD